MRSFLSNRFTLLIATTVLLSLTALGQTPNPSTKTTKVDDDVIRVESRLIVVPASVTDTGGNPVLGLTKEDFRISEEGRPQVVENVGNADVVPLEIALLFDISASTDPMFKFEQDTAAKFLQDVMRPNDRATIFTIGAKSTQVAPRGNAEKAVAAVRSITTTKEFTAFYDTVGDAAEYLRKNAPEGTRRVIVVISDGEDTYSVGISKAIQNGFKKLGDQMNTMDNKALQQYTITTRNNASVQERVRVSKSLQNADTVFYSVNPAGSSFQLNKMSVFGQENMQKFADETGGTAFLPKFLPSDTKDTYQNDTNIRKNTETLDRIFRQLANELRSQYLIQYYSDAEFARDKYVKLEVGLSKRPELKMRARQGYYVKN